MTKHNAQTSDAASAVRRSSLSLTPSFSWVWKWRGRTQPLQRFSPALETVETVQVFRRRRVTQLNRNDAVRTGAQAAGLPCLAARQTHCLTILFRTEQYVQNGRKGIFGEPPKTARGPRALPISTA